MSTKAQELREWFDNIVHHREEYSLYLELRELCDDALAEEFERGAQYERSKFKDIVSTPDIAYMNAISVERFKARGF